MVAKDVHWIIKSFSHPNYETDSGIFTDKGKKPQEDKKLKIYTKAKTKNSTGAKSKSTFLNSGLRFIFHFTIDIMTFYHIKLY